MIDNVQTACLYVRYSSANQTEQSIEGQLRVCRDFCEYHGIRIVETYADRATSASKDIEKRVSFLKMIKDSDKHQFDAVIVYKLDRFSRSRYDMATYKYKLRRNGVQLISATENISTDPEGIILESVLEGMAEFYSAELSQKIHRGLHESALKHNSTGGQIPLGYKIENKKWVIDEETAHIVREAFEMLAQGTSIAEISRTFNAKGYRTSKGAKFGKSSFSKIFRNERYVGVYKYGDYKAEGGIPAIVDRALFDRAQARLKTNKAAPGRNKAKEKYLLSGKLFCGHCGSHMNGSRNSGGYRYYLCYGRKNGILDCAKKSISQKVLDDVVVKDAMSLLTDESIDEIATVAVRANNHEIESSTNIPALRSRLHETKVSIGNLVKALESGLAPDALVRRMVELEKEQKIIEDELKNAEKDIVHLEKAQVVYWLEQFRQGDIDDDDFRALLVDLFVNSVTVWDSDDTDGSHRITIGYNLSSQDSKTYHLPKGGRLSDFDINTPVLATYPTIVDQVLYRTLTCTVDRGCRGRAYTITQPES